MQNPTNDRAFRAQLQKLLDERGDLFHHYSTMIANPAVELSQALRDLAEENARIEGDIAALMIEQGRPVEEQPDEAPETERVAVSMSTVVSKPVSSRIAVTTYENEPNAHVEARIAGILNDAAFPDGRARVF